MKESASMKEVTPASLWGHRVLLVEDDYFVATELAAKLRAEGALLLGPVGGSAEALRLVAIEPPDCALLDINLHGQFVYELATQLRAKGIPVIFTTGYDCEVIPVPLRDVVCFRKPLDIPALIDSIRRHLQRPPRT